MKNKLADLNDHLFAQLERLSDEDLSHEQIERETKRGDAIVAVADQIIKNASLKIQADAATQIEDAISRTGGVDEVCRAWSHSAFAGLHNHDVHLCDGMDYHGQSLVADGAGRQNY